MRASSAHTQSKTKLLFFSAFSIFAHRNTMTDRFWLNTNRFGMNCATLSSTNGERTLYATWPFWAKPHYRITRITAIRWKLPSVIHTIRFCIGARMKVSLADCRQPCSRRIRHQLNWKKDGDSKRFTNAKRYIFCALFFPFYKFLTAFAFINHNLLIPHLLPSGYFFILTELTECDNILQYDKFERFFFFFSFFTFSLYIFRSLRIHVDETS